MNKHTFTRAQSSILLLADDLHYDNESENEVIMNNFREETQLTDKTDEELEAVAKQLWQVLEENNSPLYEDDGVKCDETTLSQLKEVLTTF